MQMPPYAFLFASALSLHGLRKGSLSPSGALTAFVVGYSQLAVPLRAFGVCLVVFYALGSIATKYGKKRKANIEDGYQEAGYRTASQVLCNSLSAFIASVLWSALHVPNGSILSNKVYQRLALTPVFYTVDEWCPLSSEVTNGWSRALLFAMLGHFGCCLGDTLASELGILSRSPPILITTLKPVPPGTNGGLSRVGTVASIIGGFIMGLTLFTTLVLENVRCRDDWKANIVSVLVWGAISGGLGSLIDSLLGATVQVSRYSSESKRILSDHSEKSQNGDVKVISGLNILTNNQVNLLSSMLTAVLLALLA